MKASDTKLKKGNLGQWLVMTTNAIQLLYLTQNNNLDKARESNIIKTLTSETLYEAWIE